MRTCACARGTASRGDVAKAIVINTVEKRFAFDIELLLRTVLARAGSIERVPVAWIDSGAASTTKELQPYLATLQGIVRISKRYLSPNPQSEGLGELIESLDQDSWTRLSSQFPAAIAEREPLEFDDFDGVSVEQLREIALSGD